MIWTRVDIYQDREGLVAPDPDLSFNYVPTTSTSYDYHAHTLDGQAH